MTEMNWDWGHDPEAYKRKLTSDMFRDPVRKFLMKTALVIQGLARENAPVDTGRLRGSIAYNVDQSPMPLFAEVGTAVNYAAAMEYGTGALSENPGAVGGWSFPSGDELDTWARRHGFANGQQVANIIRERGGLAPRRYLRKAFEAARRQVRKFAKEMAYEIERKWASS